VNEIVVTVYPRLHLSLLSMGSGYRRNGGLGFAIDTPATTVHLEHARELSIEDNRLTPLATDELERRLVSLRHIAEAHQLSPVRIGLAGGGAPHVGFGTGTGTTLAMVEAMFNMSGRDVARDDLVKICQRGGASGVGINTYFDGGLVFDLGVPQSDSDTAFSSSDTRTSFGTWPLVFSRIEMPAWRVGICVPRHLRSLTLQQEQDFFEQTCPINNASVHEATYHALFGCYAAAREADFQVFCAAIVALQTCEWKRLERALHGAGLREIEQALYSGGARCVGMSSLGPLLFFFTDDPQRSMSPADVRLHSCNISEVRVQNRGRTIEHA